MPEHAYDIDTRAAGFLNATPAEGRQGSLAGNSEDRHVVLMSAGHPGNHVGRPRSGRRNADPQASTLPCIPIRHENGPTLVTGRDHSRPAEPAAAGEGIVERFNTRAGYPENILHAELLQIADHHVGHRHVGLNRARPAQGKQVCAPLPKKVWQFMQLRLWITSLPLRMICSASAAVTVLPNRGCSPPITGTSAERLQ